MSSPIKPTKKEPHTLEYEGDRSKAYVDARRAELADSVRKYANRSDDMYRAEKSSEKRGDHSAAARFREERSNADLNVERFVNQRNAIKPKK
jgi:hypothetical protein